MEIVRKETVKPNTLWRGTYCNPNNSTSLKDLIFPSRNAICVDSQHPASKVSCCCQWHWVLPWHMVGLLVDVMVAGWWKRGDRLWPWQLCSLLNSSVAITFSCWCHPPLLKTGSFLQISQVTKSKSGTGLLPGRAILEESEPFPKWVSELYSLYWS